MLFFCLSYKKLLKIRTLIILNNACFLQNHSPPPFKPTFPLSTSANHQNSFTIDYLVNSFGFSPERALSLAKRLHFKTPEQPDSVLTFFKNNGFLETHIREIVRKYPLILQSKINKTLQPKIQFLIDLGMPSSKISELVAADNNILRSSVKNQLKRSLDFFMDFVQTNDNFISALNRYKYLLTRGLNSRIMPNVSFLQSHGIPHSNISKLIMIQPRTLMLNPVKFSEIVLTMKELGFDPNLTSFIYAVRAMSTMSKLTLNSKFKILKSLGWSEEEIIAAFKREPNYIMCSEKKIKKVKEFFVKKLGLTPSYLSLRPILLRYSLETRIMPRCAVLKILASKNLIRKVRKPIRLLHITEEKFLANYVTRFQEEVPDVLEAYQGKQNWILVELDIHEREWFSKF